MREHHYRTRGLNNLSGNGLDQCCASAMVSMRIRIQRSKPMRIHADPDPGQTFKRRCDLLRFRFRWICVAQKLADHKNPEHRRTHEEFFNCAKYGAKIFNR